MGHREGMCRRSWLAVVALVACVAVLTTEGCSPPIGGYKPPTLEYKMYDSDVVAYGLTKKRIPNENFPGGGHVYSVEFQIYCIFKGAPLNEIIRIDMVGEVPGLCISTNMTAGQSLLVYLRRNGDGFEPNYKEDPGDPQYMDEVTVLCEATVAYPTGRSETNHDESCPEPYNYDDCVPKPEPTEAPTPSEEPTPPTPPTPPENPKTPATPPIPQANPEAGEGSDTKAEKPEAGDKPLVAGTVEDPSNAGGSASTIVLNLGTLLLLLLTTKAL